MFDVNGLILVLLSLAGGVIAGLGGPGGLPVIIGLYSLAELPPPVQAGTTSILFAFASLFATGIYAYSGDIRKDLLIYLIPMTLIGTPIGVYLNQFIPRNIFGAFIGIISIITGLTIAYREIKGLEPLTKIETEETRGKIILIGIGLSVGMIGGMTGIGGPAISIPLLILLGIPALEAIGAGLAQGFFVTSSSALNYISSGQASTDLLIIIGPPYIFSQILGWYYAQNTDARNVKIAVSFLLVFSGLYLILI